MGLSTAIERCPECGQAYEVAYTVYNWHVCHEIPFMKRPADPVSEARMNSPVAMATSGEPRLFLCETREAFDFLTRLQGEGHIEPGATIQWDEQKAAEKSL
ncbi:MAG: hypothetical protein JW839_20925 [Candidatus Lokiarchaeota archaeon]|nr:hypothetical protein [Candidatus Lokiarchaeota archaeon]